MQKCEGIVKRSIQLPSSGSKNLKEIIKNHREEFIDYLHKLGMNVNYQSKNINYQNHSTTILTLKTTCFKVEFNDNFAKIAPLK